MERRYRANLPASVAAMNLLSVLLSDIVGCNIERYVIGLPARKRMMLVMERRCFVSPVQYASTKAIGMDCLVADGAVGEYVAGGILGRGTSGRYISECKHANSVGHRF